ncbi:uncharacterized protein [Macrobrachium rosenbergii]|uniref:uncharacterized protein n=1 Tax=Macrobrachium rosenbergii TaxID=79674 RepID=UPI0034D6A747
MKNWIAEIAGEKERLKDLLVERELKISSMRQRVEDEKEKNQLVNEDVQVMKKWIAELEGEKEKLKDRLADMEKEENEVKKISNEDKEGYYQEENEEAHELEWETSNQEEVEIIEENQGCRKEDTKFEEERLAVVNQGNEETQNNNEESNELETKEDLENRTRTPGEEDNRWSLVQSMTLETHCEKLHSIMLPAEFQELLQKNEKGLTFIKYKNKIILNFMHHNKDNVRVVLSKCSKSTAEEVLVDLQKLVVRGLAKD